MTVLEEIATRPTLDDSSICGCFNYLHFSCFFHEKKGSSAGQFRPPTPHFRGAPSVSSPPRFTHILSYNESGIRCLSVRGNRPPCASAARKTAGLQLYNMTIQQTIRTVSSNKINITISTSPSSSHHTKTCPTH